MSPISKYAHMPWASTHPFDSRDIAVSIVKTILHFFFLLRLFFIIIIILASSLTSELRCCCERKKKYRISSFWSYCCYWILNSELKKCLKKDWDEKYILRKDFFLTVFYQSCTQWCLHDEFHIFFRYNVYVFCCRRRNQHNYDILIFCGWDSRSLFFNFS